MTLCKPWNCSKRLLFQQHVATFLKMPWQRFIKSVGERTNFRRLMLASFAITPDNLYMAPYLGHSFAPAATWNLHITQLKYFAPMYSEVVNLTGLL
jgi:hypothetical protein